ncbi:MAG: hypothetical protein ACUVTN_11820 [Thermodesulfobacteriota bacterium]
MKIFKKSLWMLIMVSFLMVGFYSESLSWERWSKDDPVTDEWMIMDIVLVRPLGVMAGILGSGLFVISLPFSIPTKSVDKMSEILIVKPFEFSFKRDLPDEDM